MKKLQKINKKIKEISSCIKPHIKEAKSFINKNEYSKLIRLDRPVGTHLALLPALWAVAFVSESFLQIALFSIIFYFTATAVRGAGCIVNDMWDINFDKLVFRTKNRPLASGKISKFDALKFLVLLLVLPVIVLILLPKPAIITGCIAAIMITIYPSMKRYTNFPQVFLGFTFNLGVLIAWFAIDPVLSLTPFVLYFAAALWTTAYDTIYGHQDIQDDLKIGVKSLSIYWGDQTPTLCWKLYLTAASLIMIVGLISHMNLVFYLISAIGVYQLYWQTETVNLNDPKDCGAKFKSNVVFGLIIFAAILIGKI